VGDRRRRRAGADLDRRPPRRPRTGGGRPVPLAALRLRRLRDLHRPVLLDRPAVAARPRRGVRDRPRPRRRRDGPALVRRRQAARTSRTRSPTSSPAPGTSSTTGWTTRPAGRRGRLSAGGLLMGAVANQAPDLFGGIVAHVPFVDALTTMLDPALPLTVTEYEEWGNPEADPETTTTSPATRRTTTSGHRLPADPRGDVAQRHPGALRRAGQVGRPAARPPPDGATSCSRPRCRPVTAASRGATRPGTTAPSRSPGSSTGWASPDPSGPIRPGP
jgi:hypothetical protein